jgi:hypothetical protein
VQDTPVRCGVANRAEHFTAREAPELNKGRTCTKGSDQSEHRKSAVNQIIGGRIMLVQTDLRAGGGGCGRCKCGYEFNFLSDWEIHVSMFNSNLSGNVIGIGNDHNSYEYESE